VISTTDEVLVVLQGVDGASMRIISKVFASANPPMHGCLATLSQPKWVSVEQSWKTTGG